MAPPISRGTLLVLLSSAIAACGDTATTTSTNTVDAGAEGGADAAADASTDAGPADAGGDTGTVSVRRPFLVGASMRSALASARADWMGEEIPSALAIDVTTREFLAGAWLKDALEEHASVAAFARFSMYLLAISAPPDLVIRSQRASLDEIAHARACFALAARYGGKPLGPAALDLSDAMPIATLEHVTRLTAEEGCIGETLGAALAVDQWAASTDPHVRAILERISIDEARHADLAWRFAAWAVRTGGTGIRDVLLESCERAIEKTLAAEMREYPGVDLTLLRAHGKLTCEESRASARRTIDEVVRPCLNAGFARTLHPEIRAASSLDG